MPGEQLCLQIRQEPKRHDLTKERMPAFHFLAFLPFGKHALAASIGQIDGTAILRDKIFRLNLPPVDERQSEPIGERWPQLFHKVESEAWAARPVPMKKAHGRIEANAFRGAAAIVDADGETRSAAIPSRALASTLK
jgi:hypothetical protein